MSANIEPTQSGIDSRRVFALAVYLEIVDYFLCRLSRQTDDRIGPKPEEDVGGELCGSFHYKLFTI